MDAQTVQTVAEIYDLMWSAKFDEAEGRLEPLLKKHPLFPLLYSEVATTRYFLSEVKADYEAAATRLSAVRKDCSALYKIRKPALKQYLSEIPAYEPNASTIEVDFEKLPVIDCSQALATPSAINLKHVSSALWAKAILAEISFMEAGIKFRELKYIKGMLDFKRSWDLYKECNETFHHLFQTDRPLNEVPHLANIRCLVDFGVGLFHFACSVVPRHFQFIVEGVGFKADRRLAMEELKRSMRCESAVRSHAAALVLGWVYAFFYNNFEISNSILDLEVERFPESPVIFFTCGYIQRKQGNVQRSNEMFSTARNNLPSIPTFQLKVDYERGTNHFLLLEWEPARELLTHFLDNNEAEAFRAYCAYQIAFCFIASGEKEKAIPYMKLIQPWVRKNYDLDEYSGHQAKKFLKKGFSDFEITYQQALLSQEACNFQKVLELLDVAKSQELSLGEISRAKMLRGSALVQLKRNDEAKSLFQEVLEREKEVLKTTGYDSYAVPSSYCGMMEIALAENDLDSASTFLKKARGISGYEFETILNWRIRKGEEEIRTRK